MVIRHDEEYSRVIGTDDGVILEIKSGKKIKSDLLLWANGRTGNTSGIGLEAPGIVPDGRGLITTNQYYQTSVPHIYAVGDVVGFPALASASFDQGRIAASHLVHGKSEIKIDLVPNGIYTTPEISSIGATERELTKQAIPYEIGHAYFRHLAAPRSAARRWACSSCSSTARRSGFWESTASAIGPPRSSTSGRPSWPSRAAQHPPLLRQHDVQLPDDGGSLPGGGVEWDQSGVSGSSVRVSLINDPVELAHPGAELAHQRGGGAGNEPAVREGQDLAVVPPELSIPCTGDRSQALVPVYLRSCRRSPSSCSSSQATTRRAASSTVASFLK